MMNGYEDEHHRDRQKQSRASEQPQRPANPPSQAAPMVTKAFRGSAVQSAHDAATAPLQGAPGIMSRVPMWKGGREKARLVILLIKSSDSAAGLLGSSPGTRESPKYRHKPMILLAIQMLSRDNFPESVDSLRMPIARARSAS